MCFRKKNKFKKHVEEETKVIEEVKTEASKIEFFQVGNNDEQLASFVLKMKENIPLCLNFDLLEVKDANKALAFLTGAIVALDGEVYELNETSYLFVKKENMQDGTIKSFIEQF